MVKPLLKNDHVHVDTREIKIWWLKQVIIDSRR